ncbi:MAG TPA: hypothetical protein VNO84_13310 [Burkholderiaceae bacterium]|nr:hypothetical protein [Burkholderiaceae bacterium]
MVLHRYVALAALVLCACAAEVMRAPTELIPYAGAARVHTLSAPVEFKLDSGYSRSLVEGTEFQEVGVVREGRVLKPLNATLTVEGAHIHEAYAVVHTDRLVGFYLPVEKSFSPLSRPVSLSLQERKNR